MDMKKIAQALLDMVSIHEGSYVPGENDSIGEYSLNFEQSAILATKKNDLQGELWYLLWIMSTYGNDIQWWAGEILAGRDIPMPQV